MYLVSFYWDNQLLMFYVSGHPGIAIATFMDRESLGTGVEFWEIESVNPDIRVFEFATGHIMCQQKFSYNTGYHSYF